MAQATGTSAWLPGVPTPRLELYRRSGYMMPDTVQATRGCKRVCDFCTVPVVWPQYYRRPVGDVIKDIKAIRGRAFVFNDVSLVDDPAYARGLFTAMLPLRKKWGGLATLDIVQRPDLLDLMARSGCVYLSFGFESTNQPTLQFIHKGFNRPQDYSSVMREMHSRGISVQGCFVFGFDHDDQSVFRATVEQVLDMKVDIPRYSIYTPYPGTESATRGLADGKGVIGARQEQGGVTTTSRE